MESLAAMANRSEAFIAAIARLTQAGWMVQFKGECNTFVVIVPGKGHYHCVDDHDFPTDTIDWLNELDLDRDFKRKQEQS